MHMVSEARLAFLQIQADNKGFSPQTIENLRKAGKSLGEFAVMIQVTATEMQEFLKVYKEKQDELRS